MVSGLHAAWSIPLVLTSPGYGIVGVIGAVMVDLQFGNIVGWTPLVEVHANAVALSGENDAELEAAFQNCHNLYRQSQS